MLRKGPAVMFRREGGREEGPAPRKGGSGGGVVFFFPSCFRSAVIRSFQLKSEPSPAAWQARGWLETLSLNRISEFQLACLLFFFFFAVKEILLFLAFVF